jgi:hypothetical protein
VKGRKYKSKQDRDAVLRIVQEAGWLSPDRAAAVETAVALFEAGDLTVGDMDSTPEALVLMLPGVMRYLEDDLPLAIVAAVATSRVARKQGIARRLTADAVARSVTEGALVAGLGMFEQGYYDQLGFGTGAYEIRFQFDPAHLKVDIPVRTPCRIGMEHWREAHQARLDRYRTHGGCSVLTPEFTPDEMLEKPGGFGLGFRDGPGGAISHYVWFQTQDAEYGPYEARWLAWQTREQLLELLGVIKALGDQVRMVSMQEPPGIQMQSLIQRPFQQYLVREGSRFATGASATAFQQFRICDVPGCLARSRYTGEPVRFSLRLHDPISDMLEPHAPWRGVAGDYVVTVGAESSAKRGYGAAMPTLTASVNAFTRLWLGVAPATALAVTDDFDGPAELLQALDAAFRLPPPRANWYF